MILQLPPVEVRPEALPKQVWPTLKEARRAASKNNRSLVMFIPEDATRHKAALDFFTTLEGMKARREAEVWLPRPGDPEAMQLLDEFQLRSLPVLATLSPSGKKALASRLGEDCVPLSLAFQKLLDFDSIPSLKHIQDWIGKDQRVEPFLAFARDRKEDLDAGAKEPHRTWLMGLVEGKDERLRNWAATRLVEANASWKPKEPNPFPILVEQLSERFVKEVQKGNRDRSHREVALFLDCI